MRARGVGEKLKTMRSVRKTVRVGDMFAVNEAALAALERELVQARTVYEAAYRNAQGDEPKSERARIAYRRTMASIRKRYNF